MRFALPGLFILAVISGISASFRTQAQTPDSIRSYVDSAVFYMQHHSLYADGLNWKAIRDSMQLKARGAGTYRAAFPALVYGFQQLGDPHGLVANVTADTMYRLSVAPRPLSEGLRKAYLQPRRIAVERGSGGMAYLRVPAMLMTRQEDVDRWANALRDSLCRLLAGKPKALIVDLRMNNGGNSAPMFSGLGPVFNRTLLGYGVNRTGLREDTIRLREGILMANAKPLASVVQRCTCPPELHMAVLIGPATASSGEILAMLLRQQKNVRLFGEQTGGFGNSTQGFLFRGRQGYLLLTTSYIEDASGRIYREGFVAPDEFIKSDDRYDDLSNDPTVQAARRWLEHRPTRR